MLKNILHMRNTLKIHIKFKRNIKYAIGTYLTMWCWWTTLLIITIYYEQFISSIHWPLYSASRPSSASHTHTHTRWLNCYNKQYLSIYRALKSLQKMLYVLKYRFGKIFKTIYHLLFFVMYHDQKKLLRLL